MSFKSVVLLLVASGASMATSCGGEEPLPTSPRDLEVSSDVGTLELPGDFDSDGDGLSDVDEETIVRQYRPAFAYDGQESWFPVSIDTEWALLGEYVGFPGNTFWDLPSLSTAVQEMPGGDMILPEEIYTGIIFCTDTLDYGWQLPGGCNNAAVYVEAVPLNPFENWNGKSNLVWIQYWLLSGASASDNVFNINNPHTGDWEHICVLASLDDLGDKFAPPVSIHYHRHGGVDVADTAYAYRADRRCDTSGVTHSLCYGTKHPVVYVEAQGHGSYRSPGEGSCGPTGGGWLEWDDMLNNPIRFMVPHEASSFYEVTIFDLHGGKWGSDDSPRSPLVFNSRCDHDYKTNLSTVDWGGDCGSFCG